MYKTRAMHKTLGLCTIHGIVSKPKDDHVQGLGSFGSTCFQELLRNIQTLLIEVLGFKKESRSELFGDLDYRCLCSISDSNVLFFLLIVFDLDLQFVSQSFVFQCGCSCHSIHIRRVILINHDL